MFCCLGFALLCKCQEWFWWLNCVPIISKSFSFSFTLMQENLLSGNIFFIIFFFKAKKKTILSCSKFTYNPAILWYDNIKKWVMKQRISSAHVNASIFYYGSSLEVFCLPLLLSWIVKFDSVLGFFQIHIEPYFLYFCSRVSNKWESVNQTWHMGKINK